MAETREVLVPDIGDFADVPIIEVLVSPGDVVAPEDPLVTLESDKATMDVPAPFGGTVAEIRVSVGDTVSEGSPILALEVRSNGAQPESPAPAPAEAAAAAEAVAPAEAPAPPERSPADAPVPASPQAAPTVGEDGAPPYASPGVRRIARELGVDLSAVAGSGRRNRITKEDVRAAAEQARRPAAPTAAPVTGLDLAPWPKVDFEKYGPVERRPRSRIAKISGPNLARNWVLIPHVTHHDEADVTELEAFRKRANEEHAKQGVKLTMVALLLKAAVAALSRFEQFNASLEGDDLVVKRYYHLGFAADTPQGLVVPVIRDVDRKGLIAIAGELTDLSGRAREGKLTGEEMRGGTFTISSLGGIGGTGFTPIINAPEVAILGVTRAAMKPVWNGREFEPRLMLPLSLSYDHRVIDGAAAARFTAYLAAVLNDLRRVLL